MNTHDKYELPAEFCSGNGVSVEKATITRTRMEEILVNAIEADRRRIAKLVVCRKPLTGDNETGRDEANQDVINKLAEIFCVSPEELEDPYTVVSAAKDFFANWELDRKNWDRKRRGEPVAWSGWGCQYPGKMPRLYGDRSIAEVNCDRENGDQLLYLTAASQPVEPVKVPADQVSANLAGWLSAALEDPKVCQEMKDDIMAWLQAGCPNARSSDGGVK